MIVNGCLDWTGSNLSAVVSDKKTAKQIRTTHFEINLPVILLSLICFYQQSDREKCSLFLDANDGIVIQMLSKCSSNGVIMSMLEMLCNKSDVGEIVEDDKRTYSSDPDLGSLNSRWSVQGNRKLL